MKIIYVDIFVDGNTCILLENNGHKYRVIVYHVEHDGYETLSFLPQCIDSESGMIYDWDAETPCNSWDEVQKLIETDDGSWEGRN